MRVKVLFFGVLKDVVGRSEEWVELGRESTIGDLFQLYAERHATLQERRSSIVFAKNREFAPVNTPLREKDEVAFLPPVSGGSENMIRDPAGHIFAITREPIDSRQLFVCFQRSHGRKKERSTAIASPAFG